VTRLVEQDRRRRVYRLVYLSRIRRAVTMLTALVTALEAGAQAADRLFHLERRIARLTVDVNLEVMAAACREEIPDETHDAASGGPVALRRAS
jgi:hypothetical protein